jgi:uncharacterized protein (TIGR02757 family)
MISTSRARLLKPLLDALLDARALPERVAFDPVRFPRRFPDPLDAEVAGLVASSLAYGRADLFGERLDGLFGALGPRPGALARAFDARRDAALFAGFRYRFNVGADLAALVSAAGAVQRARGSLGSAFETALRRAGAMRDAAAEFAALLRGAVDPDVERALGPRRGFDHLLPRPERGAACKRLMLFFRWMVRGGASDGVDLGLWSGISPSALVIPLDTHVARLARHLGLSRRRDLSWATAEEITASLRRLDPLDPVKYDFALCHYGMSGGCPARPSATGCARCALKTACGRRRAAPP